ncbi:tRNA-splicing endonuclease subunit Sen34 [Sphaeramia orbicularis]|uniref:tRNA-splicing endonuclease subunit Sen34 n=1 Tax=Sphaeramia orbicularis TaxID=375764 RepID=UPI00117C4166|nr:tRNA-splicing endonuclease subunit Sen34 [Sphaeramia orbicularis]
MSDQISEEQEAESQSHVVAVSLVDSTPLLWRMQDLRAVRGQGLVGALVGSLARVPRQNGRMGRPLQLLQEEQRLLGEQGAIAMATRKQVVEGAELCQEVQQHEEFQQRSYEEQTVLALEDKKSSLLRAMTTPTPHTESKHVALRGHLETLDHHFTFPRSGLAVQLSTARAGLTYCPEDRVYLQADRSPRGPVSPQSEAKYQVFRDLRGRGFYLTSAGKFGGDFLVYPGDPLRFHSHFIAICLSLDESMCLLDVLTVARLGSNVKKTVLLCSATPEGGVVYTSLQWSGMV